MSKVLIVGAGPAGIRAAQTLVKAGLHPAVVDEAAAAGGQIYRRPPAGMRRSARDRYGSEAGKAARLHALFDDMAAAGRLTHLRASSVTGLQDGSAQVLTPSGLRAIRYDRLILAAGATDRILPLPGWQAGGVYSLGAMQIALKTQEVALGRRLVLAGSGPLLTLLATQLRKAGAEVAAVLDTAPLPLQIRGGVRMALARPVVTARGLYLRASLGRRYHAGVRDLRIALGPDHGPRAVHWHDARGKARSTPCDAVGIGWHLMAETQLAELAGAQFAWSRDWSQWLPVTDRYGRAGRGLYLAGDGMRLLGADGAECAGVLAGRACLHDLGLGGDDDRAMLARLARMERFARGVAAGFALPEDHFGALPEDTIICRCENITAREIRQVTQQVGPEINRVKSLCRAGMGRCQGRYCQLATARLVAMAGGQPVEQVGRLRAQPPVRPLPVSAVLDG
ncbi:FAD-dependent oxidoreductase [Microbulbifer sp. S227A]|uniref:FAD/NAD(P)-dependent oxidoreductase n=1 Tax=Microbulbifer sp. S227A TaxID=3415131 RepID=UPI003C7B35C9